MQPYAFPYMGYFQLMNAVDRFILLDDVQYIKGGWINRNIIMGPDKCPLRFTIPLQAASQNKRINEISILHNQGWHDKLLMTIERAYRKAPCFESAWPLLQQLIRNARGNLADFIEDSLRMLNGHLQIKTPILRTSTDHEQLVGGQDRILAICQRQMANHYLNLPGGRGLYDAATFERHAIKLHFLHQRPVPYRQFKQPATTKLSIIDHIFFNDIPSLRQQLMEYDLENPSIPNIRHNG